MKVVISGYYGFDNLGDEAILKGQIELLRQKLGEKDSIVVLSNSPEITAEKYGVLSVKRDNPLALLRNIFDCDLFFNGGGGIFQDVTGRLSPVYYLSLWHLAVLANKDTWVWGEGIGPLRSTLCRAWMVSLMKRARVIGVRDDESYRMLKAFGVTQEKLYISEDLAFALSMNLRREMADWDGPIGVVLRRWCGVEELGVKLVDTLLDGFGKDVILMAFSKSDDEQVLEQIYSNVRAKSRVHIVIPVSVENAFTCIKGLSVVVGMRLHSLIFSSIVCVPFVGISYDPKVELFARRLGMDVYRIDKDVQREIVKSIYKVYNNYQVYLESLRRDVAEMRDRCFSSFDIAWEKWLYDREVD